MKKWMCGDYNYNCTSLRKRKNIIVLVRNLDFKMVVGAFCTRHVEHEYIIQSHTYGLVTCRILTNLSQLGLNFFFFFEGT